MKKDGIVVASVFILDPILDVLAFWKNKVDYNLEIKLTQYNQVLQELLNPTKLS